MTQIFVLAPRVERWVRAGRGPVSDRVENVKNGSARHCWNRSRRDGGKRGKAGVSSGWDERGDEVLTPSVLFSGKAVVWRFTYEQTLPPALSPLRPQRQLQRQQNLSSVWQQRLNPVYFAAAMQVLPMARQEIIRNWQFSLRLLWPQFSWTHCRVVSVS